MSTPTQISREDFQQWLKEYQLAKDSLPADGTIYEIDPTREIYITYEKKQDLLSVFLHIDTAPLYDEAGKLLVRPWAPVYKDQRNKNGLRCIVVGANRDIFCSFGGIVDSLKITHVKIIQPAKSGKAVLCEIELS